MAAKSCWSFIPEPVFLNILNYLTVSDILRSGIICRRWYDITRDDFLWRKIFKRDFNIDSAIGLRPDADSWYNEYKRLSSKTPIVLTEHIKDAHSHQVLHVSFSHNGKMFATCSKDSFVIIWNSTYPASIKYSHDMTKFSWKHTQFSQFNESDTLLLVSGVHFGSLHATSGEIAVFSVTDTSSHFRCRIINRPYDIFGTWFTDQHLISGDLHWLGYSVSTSVIWLNKANQEIDSEHVPIMNLLYKIYNKNASSVRCILVADCPWMNDENNFDENVTGRTIDKCETIKRTGNPLSHQAIAEQSFMSVRCSNDSDVSECRPANIGESNRVIKHSENFHMKFDDYYLQDKNETSGVYDDVYDDYDDEDELDNHCPKYLIFLTGSKTHIPHQVGFKRVMNVDFPKKLEPCSTLRERIAAKERKKALQDSEPRIEPDWTNYDEVADRFEKVDKLIDLHGHIIGMSLSPDHRYLYVNCRPWPNNYSISNPLEPPPIAEEIDIHVIDLTTLKKVGNMLRPNKSFSRNSEYYFIFLDVCEHYIASGAEDMNAYIWDRFYGLCLAKYQHTDVVNCVAFNPQDSEVMVTACDDYSIKIWRSISFARNNNVEEIERALNLVQ